MDEETIHQFRINNQRYDDLIEEMVKNKRTVGHWVGQRDPNINGEK